MYFLSIGKLLSIKMIISLLVLAIIVKLSSITIVKKFSGISENTKNKNVFSKFVARPKYPCAFYAMRRDYEL